MEWKWYDRRRIHHQAPRYLLIGVILYRRGVDIILHRCLTDESDIFLNDYHIDTCSCHLLGMSNAQKVIRQGTSSPRCFMTTSTPLNMRQMSSLRKKNISTPNSFTSNHHCRPFCKWGIDFMTCHPPSSNGHKYIVAEVYYFTKIGPSHTHFQN